MCTGFFSGHFLHLCDYLHIVCPVPHIQVTSWSRTLDLKETHHQDNGREATLDYQVKGRRPTVMFLQKTDLSMAGKQKGLSHLSVTPKSLDLHP